MLAAPLRAALLKMDRTAAAGDLAKRALRVLGGFVSSMKLKYDDVEFGLDLGSEAGIADTGDLESDLSGLLKSVAEAASEHRTALVLFIDELQYVEETQLAALDQGTSSVCPIPTPPHPGRRRFASAGGTNRARQIVRRTVVYVPRNRPLGTSRR